MPLRHIYLLDLVLNNIVHLYYLPGNVTFNPRGLNASNCTLKFAERVNVGVPKFKITSKNRRKIILASDFGHSSTLNVFIDSLRVHCCFDVFE